MREIKVIKNILEHNDNLANDNKKAVDEKGIYVLNFMSSPGAGKTSILEKVLGKLKDEFKIAVIEGDIYTTKDAERIGALDIPVVQINTEGGCHLDAAMIKAAMDSLELNEVELLVIENVGNLVCPAEFEVGEDAKVCLLSVTEGNDKPLKYPLMFEKSEAIILNKVDLIEFTNFDRDEFYRDIEQLNPNAKTFETSYRTGDGLEEVTEWIKNKVREKKGGK